MKHVQSGFALIEGVLILVIVGIIGFTGYRVWQAQTDVNNASKSAAANDTLVAPVAAISSSADLDKATSSLDQTDLNSDATVLNQDLNF